MQRVLLSLLFTLPVVAGCSAVTSTTNTAAKALEQVSDTTSQSSDATTEGPNTSYAEAREFVDSQFHIVRREAATGGGEHTAALARLMGENDPQAFGSWLQDNYGVLFSDLENHGDLVTRISAHRAKLEPIGSQDNA
ncbi:DUF3015 family protein [Spectribacter hydrogenooxidans]|uniref:DUF3015 family protein n=1 Tax=Spectribacter hydrogenoxidans TaxID=3075608 RepID=A0ABU3BWL1_9GAMM|nr:DUF3015 family protein [Salinisphaera sp. W335]MDT0633688.1 DUF3015 family protein [Salinisphaera sp. W335]